MLNRRNTKLRYVFTENRCYTSATFHYDRGRVYAVVHAHVAFASVQETLTHEELESCGIILHWPDSDSYSISKPDLDLMLDDIDAHLMSGPSKR